MLKTVNMLSPESLLTVYCGEAFDFCTKFYENGLNVFCFERGIPETTEQKPVNLFIPMKSAFLLCKTRHEVCNFTLSGGKNVA